MMGSSGLDEAEEMVVMSAAVKSSCCIECLTVEGRGRPEKHWEHMGSEEKEEYQDSEYEEY